MIQISDQDFSFEVDSLISNLDVSLYHHRLQKFLEISRNCAQLSTFDKYKLGSTISIKGKVISRGWNQEKSHPVQKLYNSFRTNIGEMSQHRIHAEMDALNKLRNLNIDLKKAEITVYRLGADGKPKMARPCAACMAAIKKSGICVINYTTSHGIATEFITSKPINVKKSKRHI
jgi:deoxycytidylate deaminase